jgi:uncharacterized protein (DUF302 family)
MSLVEGRIRVTHSLANSALRVAPITRLGACNPTLAHEVLQIEDKVGTMLPCNVVIQDIGGGRTEAAAIDPVASMQAIDKPRLVEAATQVQAKLCKLVESL